MIYIDNVSFRYSTDRWVISNLSLRIAPRTWTIIAGPEGSGKTTLAKLIKGFLKPQNGGIFFASIDQITPDQIGYIAGNHPTSAVGITVLDDICFGMENLRVPHQEMQRRVETVLTRTGLQGFENRLIHTLSGGESQKLALASVLAVGVKVLILDESFSMLDKTSRRDARMLIRNIKETLGLTVLEITNRSTDLSSADTVIFMDSGPRIEFYGSSLDFVSSPLGIRWMMPQGGIQALLSSFPNMDMLSFKHLLCSLKIDFN